MEPGRWLDPERKQEACKVGHDWPGEERQEGSDRRITPLSGTRVFVLAPSRLPGLQNRRTRADTSAGGGTEYQRSCSVFQQSARLQQPRMSFLFKKRRPRLTNIVQVIVQHGIIELLDSLLRGGVFWGSLRAPGLFFCHLIR